MKRETIAHAVITLPTGERRGAMLRIVNRPLKAADLESIRRELLAELPSGSAVEIHDGR